MWAPPVTSAVAGPVLAVLMIPLGLSGQAVVVLVLLAWPLRRRLRLRRSVRRVRIRVPQAVAVSVVQRAVRPPEPGPSTRPAGPALCDRRVNATTETEKTGPTTGAVMSRPQRPRLDAPPEALDRDSLLRSVMSTQLVGVEPAMPVRTALHVMAVRDVRHLPVIDDHHCGGLVTESDLLRGIAAQDGPLGHIVVPVRDVAGPALVLPGDTRLSDATRHMSDRKLDAVLVGSPDKLLGIVTATDVIHVWSALNRSGAERSSARRHTFPWPGPPPAAPASRGTEGLPL